MKTTDNEIKVWVNFDTNGLPKVQFIGNSNQWRIYERYAIFIEILGWCDTSDCANNFEVTWETADYHIRKLEKLGYLKTELVNLDSNKQSGQYVKMLAIRDEKRFFKNGKAES